METKICSKCEIKKNINEFYKKSGKLNLYRNQCIMCMNNSSLLYKKNNIEKINKKNNEYFEKNKELNKLKCLEYRRKNPQSFKIWLNKNKEHRKTYIKDYNSNPHIKIKNSLRSRINELMNKKYKNPNTVNLIGCDYDFLIKYIESKFTEGMDWTNYGFYGWHIDHKIPLFTANNEQEIIKLFHYSNLQPLWCNDNWKKSKKIN